MEHGTNVVVLQADPEQLSALAHRLARTGVPHAPIIESDSPYCMQLMAIGISPLVERRAIRKLVSSLPLVGRTAEGRCPG